MGVRHVCISIRLYTWQMGFPCLLSWRHAMTLPGAKSSFGKYLSGGLQHFLEGFTFPFHSLELLAALSDSHVSSGRLLISDSMDVVPHSFYPRSIGRFLRSLTRSQNSQSGLGVLLLSLFIALPRSRTRCWRMSFFG